MLNRTLITALLSIAACGLMAAGASAAGAGGAVVFSRSIETSKGAEGGLYAARECRLNQLTENPADSDPDFSADGRHIAFVREGNVWTMRADGSGQHPVTGGPEVDSHPVFAASGKYLVFERAAGAGAPRDLYTAPPGGGSSHRLTGSAADEHEAAFSADGRAIAFVHSVAVTGGGSADDVYTVSPSGGALRRLTRTGRVDEFAPRWFGAGNIVFSRGQSDEGPGAYADVFTMRGNGTRVRALITGAGSAHVEDVSSDGRLLLFRRDQGLWVKRIGRGAARKLTQVPDGSMTNAVFSSDGRRVAAFVAGDEGETLSAIDVRSGRRSQLAEGFALESGTTATTIGPVIAWQPVRSVRE
jgi:Tol biopolymer transport system component